MSYSMYFGSSLLKVDECSECNPVYILFQPVSLFKWVQLLLSPHDIMLTALDTLVTTQCEHETDRIVLFEAYRGLKLK